MIEFEIAKKSGPKQVHLYNVNNFVMANYQIIKAARTNTFNDLGNFCLLMKQLYQFPVITNLRTAFFFFYIAKEKRYLEVL